MRTVELFSGRGSFSKVARERGHQTFTVDLDPSTRPDLVKNILDCEPSDFPYKPDALWASPPCEKFSILVVSKNWAGKRGQTVPANKETEMAVEVVKKTIDLIEKVQPKLWYIENPRGMLRSLPMMASLPRRCTVTYCQYGFSYQKPTDIWTNDLLWQPRPPCKAGAKCHSTAERGAKTGLVNTPRAVRAIVPRALMYEVLASCEAQI